MTKFINVFLLNFSLLLTSTVFAEKSSFPRKEVSKTHGFLYGLGLTSNKEIYKGYNSRTMLLPLIGYKGENLTVFGPFISYKIKEFNNLKISVTLSPRFQGFDESDSYIFAGMADRKSSLDAGISLNYQSNDWKLSLSSMTDTLNRSNGFEVKSAIGRTFRFGPVFIEPSLSFSYLDKHHVDYYYGVLLSEVNQDRAEFIGEQALNTSFGISVATPIFFGGYTRMKVEQQWFDPSITNSPLVEDDSNLSIQLFFTKSF